MNKFKFLLSLAVILSVFACADEEENLPEGTIRDTEGVTIRLEWTTGGSSSQAYDAADLELYLLRGDDEIESSTGFTSEDVTIAPVYADGVYTIQVEVYTIEEDIDYTLFVEGNGNGESKSFTGSFLSTDQGAFVDHLEIEKSGDDYIITDL